jgi:hypothetical protein
LKLGHARSNASSVGKMLIGAGASLILVEGANPVHSDYQTWYDSRFFDPVAPLLWGLRLARCLRCTRPGGVGGARRRLLMVLRCPVTLPDGNSAFKKRDSEIDRLLPVCGKRPA